MKRDIRFNIIDLLICFVVFVVFFVSAVFLSDDLKEIVFANGWKNWAEITVKTDLLSEDYSDKLMVGQTVIDYDTGEELGGISDIRLIYPEQVGTNDPKFYAIIEIASAAEYKGEYFLLGGKKLLMNKIKRFSVPELYFEGSIITIAADGYER